MEFQVVPPYGGHPLLPNATTQNISFKSCPRMGGIKNQLRERSRPKSFKSCPRMGGIDYIQILYQVG